MSRPSRAAIDAPYAVAPDIVTMFVMARPGARCRAWLEERALPLFLASEHRADVPVAVTDPSGMIAAGNDGLVALFGASTRDDMRLNTFDLHEPVSRDVVARFAWPRLRAGYVTIAWSLLPGQPMPVLGMNLPVRYRGRIRWIASAVFPRLTEQLQPVRARVRARRERAAASPYSRSSPWAPLRPFFRFLRFLRTGTRHSERGEVPSLLDTRIRLSPKDSVASRHQDQRLLREHSEGVKAEPSRSTMGHGRPRGGLEASAWVGRALDGLGASARPPCPSIRRTGASASLLIAPHTIFPG